MRSWSGLHALVRGARASAAHAPRCASRSRPRPTTDQVSLAISPDGDKLVFVASSEGRPQLWLRSLDNGSAQPLAGYRRRVVSILVTGQPVDRLLRRRQAQSDRYRRRFAAVLRRLPWAPAGTWNREGVILYTLVPDAPISRVPAVGGKSSSLPEFPASVSRETDFRSSCPTAVTSSTS